MAPNPFWKGKDCKLLFTLREQKLLINLIDLEVTRVGDAIEDHICGEDRARPIFVVSHFGILINAHQQQAEALSAFIAEQRDIDSRKRQIPGTIGILIFLPGFNAKAAFGCTGYCVDAWKLTVGGRKERNKIAIPGRCQDFVEIPTI